MALRALAIVGMAWLIFTWAYLIFRRDAFQVAIPTESGVTILTASDFSELQRLSLIALVSLPELCWVGMMWQVIRMSFCFARGEILSTAVVRHLRRFGMGLFVMGAAEMVMFPLLNAYLQWLKVCEPIEDLWAASLDSGFFESFMAGVLVVIMAKIFDLGIRLKEEMELTV